MRVEDTWVTPTALQCTTAEHNYSRINDERHASYERVCHAMIASNSLKQATYPREGKICNLSLPDIFARPLYGADRNGIDQLTRATGSFGYHVPSGALFQWRATDTCIRLQNCLKVFL
ncbi:uncharacterized protein LOC116851001 [Odontomachus brunneus]|uniref:uncharacterized protein LOC116851001 n=1 Tax=Odontomachus brunneus TaxID=486640 RepID=UPI0013F256D2|nr:uncharacterized protein LOC116851001 [Odontomachus brunneus]